MRTVRYENKDCPVLNRFCGIAFASLWLFSSLSAAQEPIKTAGPRLIEVIADHKSHFTVPGQSEANISVKAGEKVRLRITAIKAANRNRDGSVHGFTLLRAKDHQPVDGWDFLLQPGTQEFIATAPMEPGTTKSFAR